MRLVVVCILFFWNVSLSAQVQVRYDVFYVKKTDGLNPERALEGSTLTVFKEFKTILAASEGVLVACDNQSYFKIEPAPNSVIENSVLASVFINQSSWLTKSNSAGNINRKRMQLVVADYNLDNWTVDYSTKKMIAGYTCFKATKKLIFKDASRLNRSLEVWFTPSLAINSGLRDATGLPGLILYYNDENWEFMAKSVEQIKKCNIDIPNLDKISFTENERLAKQRMDEHRNRTKK